MLFEFVVRSGKELGRTIAVDSGQTVTLANAAGKTVSFKAVATNSTGSTDSAVKTVVMP